jgi:hypothetical protein
MVLVKKSRKAAFDPKIFLAMVGDGKTISKYQKDQIVFSQGDVADGTEIASEVEVWRGLASRLRFKMSERPPIVRRSRIRY